MVQQQVVERSSGQEAAVLVVWVDMLRFDSEKASRKARDKHFSEDARVWHFWDPKNRVPEALGARFGWKKGDPAWDVYLFYDGEAKWTGKAPASAAYFHQLSRHMDDEGHFFVGEDLAAKVGAAADELLRGGSE